MDGGGGDSETDDDDDDYGPTPAAGVWAGGSKLESESEKLADGLEDDNRRKENSNNYGEEEDDSDDDNDAPQPSKKIRTST